MLVSRAPLAALVITNGHQDGIVGWKPVGVLRCHSLLIDMHRKLSAPADDELGAQSSLLLDQRRHTGRAGMVISHLAVSNGDALHHTSRLTCGICLCRVPHVNQRAIALGRGERPPFLSCGRGTMIIRGQPWLLDASLQ